MTKRVALSTILAAGLLAIPAAQTVKNGPVASTTAIQRADDPPPCPDCEGGPLFTSETAIADARTDDPPPCPDCEGGPLFTSETEIADARTDDPPPCPDCEGGPLHS
jgi:hypothetical protein